MRWRIHYADGSTFADSDGPVENAPGWGVVLIAQEDVTPQPYNIGRRYFFQRDFYCWHGDARGWDKHDFVGLVQYLGSAGWKKTLYGQTVLDSAFHAIKAKAEADDYLPLRGAANE